MRTFLALSFSVGSTRRIAEAVEREANRLRDAQPGWKLAWVPPANLHVTLKFLGEVIPETVDAIAVRLRRRCADLAPFSLRAKGFGSFPLDGDPRVLWIGVAESKALTALQQAVESDMEDLGFAREARPFHPHVTIARVLEAAPSDGAWPPATQFDLGTDDQINEIIVYESKAHRAGAEYIARSRIRFSKNR